MHRQGQPCRCFFKLFFSLERGKYNFFLFERKRKLYFSVQTEKYQKSCDLAGRTPPLQSGVEPSFRKFHFRRPGRPARRAFLYGCMTRAKYIGESRDFSKHPRRGAQKGLEPFCFVRTAFVKGSVIYVVLRNRKTDGSFLRHGSEAAFATLSQKHLSGRRNRYAPLLRFVSDQTADLLLLFCNLFLS